MKTATKKKTQKWPMVRVNYHGPKPDEILSFDQARKRFGLDEEDLSWLTSPYTSGTSIRNKPNSDGVDMIHRYTREDSIRDAAGDLLKALVDMVECSPCRNGCRKNDLTCATRAAQAAIKKAERS